MIVYSQPKYKVCTCKTCGTVFQPEPSDSLEYFFKGEIGIDEYDVFARCPTCSYCCPVTVVESEDDI